MLRRFEGIAPAGGRYASGFGAHTMALQVPLSVSEISYSAFSEIRRHDGFVLLRVRNSGGSVVLPGELFPPADFAAVERAIRAVAGRTEPLSRPTPGTPDPPPIHD